MLCNLNYTNFGKGVRQEDGCTLEFFKEDELLVNITEYELVPRHVLLSNKDKLELLKR